MNNLGLLVLLVVMAGVLSYPGIAFATYYKNFANYKGLDGLSWFRTEKPEENTIVDYLEKNRNGKNLVEAAGDSYTQHNAVSVFSATPTVVGWKVHEWLWRGGYDQVAARANDVASIYTNNDPTLVKNLLKKYNVGWVVIGEKEKLSYEVNIKLLESLGEVVLKQGNSELIQ